MLSLLGLSGVLFAQPLEHKVVFLLDVSQSMCGHLKDDAKIDEIKTTAKKMLNDSNNIEGINISFYQFGDMTKKEGKFVPDIRIVKEGLPPSEAIKFIDEFFQYTQNKKYCAKNVFPDSWTYVASSVRYVIEDVLELPSKRCDPRWGKYNPEDNPAPQVTILGITDQAENGKGESTPCGISSEANSKDECRGDYKEYHPINVENMRWMDTESGLLQNFNYQFWNIDSENKNPLNVDRTSVYYRVEWYGPNDLKDHPPVNLKDAGQDVKWSIDGKYLPKIRLHPLFLNPQEDAIKALKEQHALFNGSSKKDISSSKEAQKDVSLFPVYEYTKQQSAKKNRNLTGIQFKAPSRQVANGEIELREMEISFEGMSVLHFEEDGQKTRASLVPGGNHVLRLDIERFAEELSAQYPNSSFIFSTQTYNTDTCEDTPSINLDESLPALVRLTTESKNLASDYTFTWKGEGELLDAPVTIGFDRLWNASWINPSNPDIKESNHSRTALMTGTKRKNRNNKAVQDIKTEEFSVEYSAYAVDSKGNDIRVEDLIDMNAFYKDGTIIIPPREPLAFGIADCFGFCYGSRFPLVASPTIDGPIKVTIKATPTVKSSEFSNEPVVRIELSEERNYPEALKSNQISFEVHIQKAPIHYVRITQISIISLISFWFWIGWIRRPRFADKAYLGLDASLTFRTRMETIGGIVDAWKYSTFRSIFSIKRPCYYLQLDQNIDETLSWNSAAAPSSINEGFIIGIAPHKNKKTMYLWCASCDSNWSMVLKGNGLFSQLKPIPSSELFYKSGGKKGKLNLNAGIERIGIGELEGLAIHLITSERENPTVYHFFKK